MLIGQFAFRMNLSERWRLEAEYFSLNRDSEQQIARTIDWGDREISDQRGGARQV